MYEIKAPVRTYNGLSAGVPFTQGVGYTDNPHLVKWFKSKGYEAHLMEPNEKEEPEIKDENVDGAGGPNIEEVEEPEELEEEEPAEEVEEIETKPANRRTIKRAKK